MKELYAWLAIAAVGSSIASLVFNVLDCVNASRACIFGCLVMIIVAYILYIKEKNKQ